MIKRGSMWSSRYAQIKNAIFSYKKDMKDKNVRQTVDLRRSKIMKATKDSGEPYFVIRDEKNGGQEYCLRPETLDDYKKWAGVLAESVRTDEDF